MAESVCEGPFDGVIINESTRLMNLIQGLLNEIEEWQDEESVEDEGIQEHDITKETPLVQVTKEELEETCQESEG